MIAKNVYKLSNYFDGLWPISFLNALQTMLAYVISPITLIQKWGAFILHPNTPNITSKTDESSHAEQDSCTIKTSSHSLIKKVATVDNLKLLEKSMMKTNMTIIPNQQLDHKKIAALINTCDEKENGRKPYGRFKDIGNGNFLFSETGMHAIKYRKRLTKYMAKHQAFAVCANDLILKSFAANQKIDLDTFSPNIVRNVIFKLVLGINDFPTDMHTVISLASRFGFQTDTILDEDEEYNDLKIVYEKLANKILSQQLNSLLTIFNHYPHTDTNLIADTIIDLIANERKLHNTDELKNYLNNISKNEIKKYLSHSDVKTLPLILIAGENLIRAITFGIKQLDEKMAAQLAEEISKEKIFNPSGTITDAAALKKCPLLDAFYKETLRIITEQLHISRFTEEEVQIGNISIPKNSNVIIALGSGKIDSTVWKAPIDTFYPSRFFNEDKNVQLHQYPFMPFSTGKRSCPGFMVAEDIFKSTIATLVYHNVMIIHHPNHQVEIEISPPNITNRRYI